MEIVKAYQPFPHQIVFKMKQRQRLSGESVTEFDYNKPHLCLQDI